MACLVTENAAVISACEAITAAQVARPISGASAQVGAISKNGLPTFAGSASSIAPWPK